VTLGAIGFSFCFLSAITAEGHVCTAVRRLVDFEIHATQSVVTADVGSFFIGVVYKNRLI